MNISNKQLKPVRIVLNERIKEYTNQVLGGLETALKLMTDQEVKLTPLDPFLMPIETYITAYKKKSIMLKLFAEEAFHGEIYWFFELQSAILLGSYLRMMTPDARKEKVSLETFDATDEDSFGEVGNQLCGILDRIFRNLTPRKIHLRLDFKKKAYPDETITVDQFINKEEYVVFLANLTLPELGSQKLTLLLPRSLFEVLLNMEIQLEGISPKTILLYSWDTDFCERMQKELNTRFTKVVIAREAEDILHLAKTMNPCAVAMELKDLRIPLAHNDSIFIKRVVANDALKKVPFMFTVSDANANTIMYLQQLGLQSAANIDLHNAFESWVRQLILL